MRGGHCLKVRTKKQQVVSLSTAESERYAAVNTAPEGLEILQRQKRFVTKNVGTKLNTADLMTKPLPGPQILHLMQMMGCEFVGQHLEREGLHCTKLVGSQQRAERSLIVVSLLLVTAQQVTRTIGWCRNSLIEMSLNSRQDRLRESVDV